MHADEIELDDVTVRGLLLEQFPQWSGLPLRRIPDSGTDNAIYRLGDDMGLRLPRIHWAVAQIDKECRTGWAGLADHLPAPVPVPLGRGEPGHGYPYPWLVYPWLPGTSLDRTAGASSLVADVASFVLALQQISPEGGPPPGRRGGPMAPRRSGGGMGPRDPRRSGRHRGGPETCGRRHSRPSHLRRTRCGSTATSCRETSSWREGRLAGVIDWSATGVGDPACDAMFAWSLGCRGPGALPPPLGFDDATWARARGWVVEQTVLYIPYYAQSLPMAVAQAKTRLEAALSDEP